MNFGSDLLIVDGALVFNGDNLVTVDGLDNVKQQAHLRSTTDLGESLFFSSYGGKIYEYLAKPYTPENIQKVENEARSILLSIGSEYGKPWINEVLECRYGLVEVDGKTVKTIYTKYIVNEENQPIEYNFNLIDNVKNSIDNKNPNQDVSDRTNENPIIFNSDATKIIIIESFASLDNVILKSGIYSPKDGGIKC